MRLLVIPVLCFLGWFGSKDFKIIEATQQDWTGGRQESGYGTSYKITLEALTSEKNLVVDQLWVKGEYYEVKGRRWTDDGWVDTFKKGDKIIVQATLRKGGMMIQEEPKEKLKAPFDYDGDAIIGYLYKGKRKYKKLESIKKLKKEFYP